jgi:hypothetical protein
MLFDLSLNYLAARASDERITGVRSPNILSSRLVPALQRRRHDMMAVILICGLIACIVFEKDFEGFDK